MSVLCVDIGNFAAVGAVPRDRGIDVITSVSGSKQIPSCVSINSNRRFFADNANSQRVTNRPYCYHCLPYLLGEKYDSPAVHRIRDLGFDFNLKENPETHDAYAAIYFGGEQRVFRTASLVTSIISELRKFSTNDGEYDAPTEVCVAVPGNWSANKCHYMRAAAEGAGMKCIGLVPQHAAVGVGYYMKRVREFQPTDPKVPKIRNTVVFLSVGQLSSYLSVQTMSEEGITVNSAYYDPCLGAAEFDNSLFKIVVAEILEKYKGKFTSEELNSGKTRAKILKACNAAKKILSTNNKAPVSIDCIGEMQMDVSLLISLDQFNEACKPIIERFHNLIIHGLNGTPAEDCSNIDFVEIIGGASRVQCLREMAENTFCPDGRKERITRRLNADEATAIGLGWVAALRSTRHRVAASVPIVDGIACLSDKLYCELRNAETGEYITQPGKIAIYENGMTFPSARKTTLRVMPSKRYELVLREGENGLVHEKVEFEILPNNNLKIAANCTEEQMRKAGVERDDQSVNIKIKFHCDADGSFKVASIKRTDAAIDWVVRKVRLPNPEYTMMVQELEKQKETATANDNDTENNNTESAEAPASDAAGTTNENDAADIEAKKKEIPREIDTEEKLPKIIQNTMNVEFKVMENVQNAESTSKILYDFERICAGIDARADEYDIFVNKLEELIYDTRNNIENKVYTLYADEKTITDLQAYIDGCIEFVYALEGVEQLPEIKSKYETLLNSLKVITDRKASFEVAQEKLEALLNRTNTLLNRLYPTDVLSVPEIPEGREEVDGKIETRRVYREKLTKLCGDLKEKLQNASRLQLAPVLDIEKGLKFFDEAENAMKPELKPETTPSEPEPEKKEPEEPVVAQEDPEVAAEPDEKSCTETNENEAPSAQQPAVELETSKNENENEAAAKPDEEEDPHGAANLD